MRGVGISQDVTARMQADETRARLAAIVDSTDDAIYSTTLDDTVLTWNAGAERLYGYAAAEVIGRNRSLIVPAGASAGLTAAMLEKAGRGEAGEPFETKRVRKDGLADRRLAHDLSDHGFHRASHRSVIDRAGHRKPKESRGRAPAPQ